jgi:hypothetical protein
VKTNANPYLVHTMGCNHRNLTEARLSHCSHGCKIYRCKDCDQEMLIHYEGYGCHLTKVEYL